jgi:hypothetical protein
MYTLALHSACHAQAALLKIKGMLQKGCGAGGKVSVIFDGMTYLGETLCVVLRFWHGGILQHYCISFQLLAKSLSATAVMFILFDVLHNVIGLNRLDLMAATTDRHIVNILSMTEIQRVYTHLFHCHCFSHTLSQERQCTCSGDTFLCRIFQQPGSKTGIPFGISGHGCVLQPHSLVWLV